jgi:hypothetical protein
LIKQSQIGGTIGATLEDDLKYIRENSGSVRKIEQTIERADITVMQKVLDVSTIVDPEKNVVLVNHVLITNNGASTANFRIENFGAEVQVGTVESGKTISLSSEMSDLKISLDQNCTVNYTLRYV